MAEKTSVNQGKVDGLVGCDTCKHCDEGVDDNGMGWDLEQYEIWTYRDCAEGHDIEKEPRKSCADYEPND